MHMHLNQVKVTNTNNTVTYAHKFFTKLVYISLGGLFINIDNKELGAVRKLNVR